MPHPRIIITALAVVAASSVAKASTQGGAGLEQSNVVSRHRAFMVVKQPDQGVCHIEQADTNASGGMELTFDGTAPVIVSPFYRGIEGELQYWVDNSARRTVPSSKIGGSNIFVLPADTVGMMKAGRTLYVHVTPAGKPPRTQEFSLMGFTAATRILTGPECQGDRAAPPSPPNLEVKLTRISGGGVVVSGSTVLPDGMNLRVSLQTNRSAYGYYAQETVRVHSSFYESTAFTDRGRPLPSGAYTVSISSPLMYLQPLRVQRALDASGSKIPEDIRQKSSYDDSYTVNYSVSRSLD